MSQVLYLNYSGPNSSKKYLWDKAVEVKTASVVVAVRGIITQWSKVAQITGFISCPPESKAV